MPSVKQASRVRVITAEGEEKRVTVAGQRLAELCSRLHLADQIDELEKEITTRKGQLAEIFEDSDEAVGEIARAKAEAGMVWDEHERRKKESLTDHRQLMLDEFTGAQARIETMSEDFNAREILLRADISDLAEAERELQEREVAITDMEEKIKTGNLAVQNAAESLEQQKSSLATRANKVEEEGRRLVGARNSLAEFETKLHAMNRSLGERDKSLTSKEGGLILKIERAKASEEDAKVRLVDVRAKEALVSRELKLMKDAKEKFDAEIVSYNRNREQMARTGERMAQKHEDLLRAETKNKQDKDRLIQVERSVRAQMQLLREAELKHGGRN